MKIQGMAAFLCCWLSVVFCPVPASAGTRDESEKLSTALIEALGPGRLNKQTSYAISKVKIESGPANLILEHGVIFPADPVGGKVRELVFVGLGTFKFKAPDTIESQQLEMFTGSSRMEEPFESVVIGTGSDGLVAQLLQSPVPTNESSEAARNAEKTYQAWCLSPERKKWDIDVRILETLLDQTTFSAFFSAWVEGKTLDRFMYGFFPGDEEPIVLGQFVPDKNTEAAWDSIDQDLPFTKKRYGLTNLDLRDFGSWDSWVLAARRDESDVFTSGRGGFEVLHYDLDVSLDKEQLSMTARCHVSIAVKVGGGVVIPFVLASDLVVDGVSFKETAGDPVYFRYRDRLYVTLPERAEGGRRFEAEIRYHGKGLKEDDCVPWSLWSAAGWYPQIPGSERSVFQVTYHFPKEFQIAGGGLWQERGLDSADRAWERRVVERPAPSLSFGIGSFNFIKGRAGHVEITLAVDPNDDGWNYGNSGLSSEDLLATVIDVVEYFEKEFGPYPLDYLTVVAAPARNTPKSLGLVWLNDSFRLFDQTSLLSDNSYNPPTFVAHELAGQWWGQAVGWKGPRDQWLGEAMATLASNLYAKDRLKADFKKTFIPINSRWKSTIRTMSESGQWIDSLGPIVLSNRLVSSKEGDSISVNKLVAVKGAMVLSTIAETFKNSQDFHTVLQTIFQNWNGKMISTEQFIRSCSEAAGVDFDPVVRPLIFGTGVPDVYYSYSIGPASDGGWLLKGEADRFPAFPPRFRISLRRVAEGGVDVVRNVLLRASDDNSVLVAPIQIVFKETDDNKKGSLYVSGKLVLKGPKTSFEFKFPDKPVALMMDPENRVLAFFHNENLTPQRVLFYRGRWAFAMGDLDGALDLFRKALDAPVSTAPSETHPDKFSKQREKALGKKLIHQQMARLFLDLDQTDRALKAMKATERNWSMVERYLDQEENLLEARLAARRGDYQKAFSLLENSLDVGKISIRGVVLNVRKHRSRPPLQTGEAMAILSVVAQRTGHYEHHKEAFRLAKRRGADLSLCEGSGGGQTFSQ